MAKKKTKQKEIDQPKELLDIEIQEIINDTGDSGSLFNHHKLLIEKGRRNILVCKQNDAKKLKNKTHEWVSIDSKTSVLRKIRKDGKA